MTDEMRVVDGDPANPCVAVSPGQPTRRGRWKEAALLLLLGFLIGIAFLNSPGTEDRGRWLLYMGVAREHGILATYPIAVLKGVGGFTTDYPPLTFIILGLLSRVADLFQATDFVVLKLSLNIGLLACACVMAAWQGRWRPLLGVATFLVLALDALLQVYLDVYFAFFLLLGFYCLERQRMAAGTALIAVAVLTKWQPIILAPLVLLYVIPRPPKLVHFGRLVPAALPFLAVLLLYGTVSIVAFAAGVSDTRLSGKALNFNWLLTGLMELHAPGHEDGLVITLWSDKTQLAGVYRYLVALSTALRYVCYLVSVCFFYFSQRTFAEFVQASIACFMAYFIFGPGVHENHAFVPALLALCWVAMDRTRYFEATLLAVTFNLNLFIFYGSIGSGLGFSRVVGWDSTILLAAFNMIVFAVLWLPVARRAGSEILKSAPWRTADARLHRV